MLYNFYKKSFLAVMILSWTSAASQAVPAGLTLPPILSDHMVLQRSDSTKIWGEARPGAEVTVTLNSTQARGATDQTGRWCVALNLKSLPEGPFDMVVKADQQVLTVKDVVLGDVWLCSGQSNMDFSLDRIVDAQKEIAVSANNRLRTFHLDFRATASPREAYKGEWKVCGPQSAGGFTAVGYYFGQRLTKAVDRPVGLVHTSWGGTPVEAWISAKGFENNVGLKEMKTQMSGDVESFPEQQAAYARSIREWEKKAGVDYTPPADLANWVGTDVDLSRWRTVKLPNDKTPDETERFQAVWYRKAVMIPPKMTDQTLILNIGNLHQFDSVYWNGVSIGNHSPDNYPGAVTAPGRDAWRRYEISESLVKDGRNDLAIRLYALNGTPYITNRFFLIQTKSGTDKVYLEGVWRSIIEEPTRKLSQQALASIPAPLLATFPPQFIPSYLFNGMIAPLINYRITGYLWYQGEQNVGQAEQYRAWFPLLIKDWRQQWGIGELPFYFCQLPNFKRKTSTAGSKPEWAELRSAQTAALALPNTGMAVTIDVGEAEDIHPREKRIVGERLAALALAKTYGMAMPHAGPELISKTVETNHVRLRFSTGGGRLAAKPVPKDYVLKSIPFETAPLERTSPESELEGFEVAGPDQKWVWANARIDGDSVLVEAPSVSAPTALRYAWADNPSGNLYNEAGYPAAPFSITLAVKNGSR